MDDRKEAEKEKCSDLIDSAPSHEEKTRRSFAPAHLSIGCDEEDDGSGNKKSDEITKKIELGQTHFIFRCNQDDRANNHSRHKHGGTHNGADCKSKVA